MSWFEPRTSSSESSHSTMSPQTNLDVVFVDKVSSTLYQYAWPKLGLSYSLGRQTSQVVLMREVWLDRKKLRLSCSAVSINWSSTLRFSRWCKHLTKGAGAAKHKGSVRPSHPAAPGLILGIPKIYCLNWFLKWLRFTELALRNEDSGFNNVDLTHLGLLDIMFD